MNSVGKALLMIASVALSALGHAQERAGREDQGVLARAVKTATTGNLIVKWRDSAPQTTASARAQKASAVAGSKLRPVAQLNERLQLIQPERPHSAAELERVATLLERDSAIEYASVEYRRKVHELTNDPLLTQQWYLLSAQPAATRTESAWDITHGDASVVVAVLDTGVRFDHPDLGIVAELGGKLLPGYDFVSNPIVANDGDGRDDDASDPGDWVTPTDVEQNGAVFKSDCLTDEGEQVNSSWHGTRVAGLIAARTNNAFGIAGNAWKTLVVPVRVLGKCGGNDFDIIAGMRWAAGLPVTGAVPERNPTPAKIINLSLGGEGACTMAYQSVIDEVTAAGTLVVASAGNEGTAVSVPGNCNGVLGVAGIRNTGTKVGFSNLGQEVSIGAPGGNCVNTAGTCQFPILVATNAGTTTPSAHIYSDQMKNINVGTSFSAPMVASAAALVRAVNNSLTPNQIILLVKESATPYPTNPAAPTCTVPTSVSPPQDAECNCTTQTCGAGILNTAGAVVAALGPLAVIETAGMIAIGATMSINGANSFPGPGRTLAAFQWSITNIRGATPTIANPSSAATTLQIPAASEFTLRLTVTDDQGAQHTKEVVLVTPATPPPTQSAPATPANSDGHGGGGTLGLELLAVILLGRARKKQKRHLGAQTVRALETTASHARCARESPILPR